MALSLTCRGCRQVITGADEDELVANVQEHVAGHGAVHGRSHEVGREHVLARLHRQRSRHTRQAPRAAPAPGDDEAGAAAADEAAG